MDKPAKRRGRGRPRKKVNSKQSSERQSTKSKNAKTVTKSQDEDEGPTPTAGSSKWLYSGIDDVAGEEVLDSHGEPIRATLSTGTSVTVTSESESEYITSDLCPNSYSKQYLGRGTRSRGRKKAVPVPAPNVKTRRSPLLIRITKMSTHSSKKSSRDAKSQKKDKEKKSKKRGKKKRSSTKTSASDVPEKFRVRAPPSFFANASAASNSPTRSRSSSTSTTTSRSASASRSTFLYPPAIMKIGHSFENTLSKCRSEPQAQTSIKSEKKPEMLIQPLSSHIRDSNSDRQFNFQMQSNVRRYQQDKDTEWNAKRKAFTIGNVIRNLLKLPKAHKWTLYEFFYSDIDKAIFQGVNDFEQCFQETFPDLKARKLTRLEWNWIRRKMGKPRRCSASFLEEERNDLHVQRDRIRVVQRKKRIPYQEFNAKDLPETIPLLLHIGTRVTVRLRQPHDGIFRGVVHGIDISNSTYRVTCDRPGLGSFSVPDFEVFSEDPVETVPVSSLFYKPPKQVSFETSRPDSILNQLPMFLPIPANGTIGGFKIRLLVAIVLFSKLLKKKTRKISELKDLNVEAEKIRAYGKSVSSHGRVIYSKLILDLVTINKELTQLLEIIQLSIQESFPIQACNLMIVPKQIKEQSEQEADSIVETLNSSRRNKLSNQKVKGKKSVGLITNLASVLLQFKNLQQAQVTAGGLNMSDVHILSDTLNETKAALIEGNNVKFFQSKIEVPVKQLQIGLCVPKLMKDLEKKPRRPSINFAIDKKFTS